MIGPHFSLNGDLRPIEEGVVAIDDVNFAYGFGVYETMKLRKGVLYFPDEHEERLFHSARVLGLEHHLAPGDLVRATKELCVANGKASANLKALLIGGRGADDARLYIMELNPLYPDRKLYKKGASAIVFEGERQFPDAKSLNMTMSAIAYRKARSVGAYDALLQHRDGIIPEGTRTNLFFTDGSTILTPPDNLVLDGVTRRSVLSCARSAGYSIDERIVHRGNLSGLDGLFLTSTSSKIMPLSKVDNLDFSIPDIVRDLMGDYETWLNNYSSSQEALPISE